MRLHADAWGPEGGLPVVCLPGLTRNARDFGHLARVLSGEEFGPARRVIVLEARGRGRSARADGATYTLAHELGDLVAALDQFGIRTAQFVGTSRGGLATMLLATVAADRIERVVLNDIGPTLDVAGLVRIAAGLGGPKTHASLDALAAAQKAAIGVQFPRLTDRKWRRLAAQLASEAADGTATLDYDPALGNGFAKFDGSAPAPDFWPAFDALKEKPVLVIRGAHSDLLSAATVEAMRRRHRGLKTLIVGDEGHAPLLWDRGSCQTIKAFLS